MKVRHTGIEIVGRCAALATVAVLAAGCDASAFSLWKSDTSASATNEAVPLATPAGIEIQPLGKAQGYGLDKESATLLPREQIAYADARGMTLYTRDADPVGKSTCVDRCAKLWPPAIAAPDAQPMGEWTLITRDDGRRQWAFKGKALYTYAQDVDIGSVAGNSPKRFGRGPNVGPRGAIKGPRPKNQPMPEGWHVALLYPISGMSMPVVFSVKEVPDALGLVLVDAQQRTLYYFDGELASERETCAAGDEAKVDGREPCEWEPLAAPQVAAPLGQFSFIERDDGIRQWTWKGLPLYTYARDFAPGYADGVGTNEHWHVAQVVRYFMPEGVQLQHTAKLGKILANADGMALYRRDGFIFQSGSGHNLRHGIPVRPAVGRDLGTDPRCATEACRHSWAPFLAPADAQPRGYWDVYTRADGRKQWAYQGYALWTYSGDHAPGEINGNDMFQLAMSDDPEKIVDIGTPYDGPTALYWSVGIP